MKQDERALWALETVGELDPAILTEAEAMRARPNHRRIAVLAAAALLCTAAIGAGVALSRRGDGDVTPPVETTGTAETGEGQADSAIGDQTAHVRWAGLNYHYAQTVTRDNDIVPGKVLGEVVWDSTARLWKDNAERDAYDPFWTASNVVPIGGKIYAVEGSSTGWRICAYDQRGRLCLFVCSRNTELGASRIRLANLLPDPEDVTHIGIYRSDAISVLGEITEPEEITWLIRHLHVNAKYLRAEDYIGQLDTTAPRLFLDLTLADGTQTSITLSSDTLGRWMDYFALPPRTYEKVTANILYDPGEEDYESMETLFNQRNEPEQILNGMRFSLSASGTLTQDGAVIARDVRDFALDACGVVYATPKGAYRRLIVDGSTVQLLSEDVRCIDAGGLYIHYATASGEIGRVRCDGTHRQVLAQVDGVTELLATDWYYRDLLAALDAEGRVWAIANRTRYLLAEGVRTIQSPERNYLTLFYQNGHTSTEWIYISGRYVCTGIFGQRLRGGVPVA